MSVAAAIDSFGRALDPYLATVAGRSSVEDPLTAEEYEQVSIEPARAQLALVNAIRRSLGKNHGTLRI